MRFVSSLCVIACAVCVLFVLSCSTQESNKPQTQQVVAFDSTGMDTSVCPCTDFDNYVNGTWKKHTKLPEGYSFWGAFLSLRKKTADQLNTMLLSLTQKENKKGSIDQQLADFYRSYMDSAAIEKIGLTPLQVYLDEIQAIQNWKDFYRVSAELSPLYVSTLFSLAVNADDKKSDVNAVKISQTALSIGDKDYYLRNDKDMKRIRDSFLVYVERLFEVFGVPAAQAKTKAKAVLQTETDLAAMHLSKVERRNPVKIYNKISLAEAAIKYPQTGLKDILARLAIQPDSVLVESPVFLEKLNRYLSSGQKLDAFKSYLSFDLMNSFAHLLNAQTQRLRHNFYSGVLRGVWTMRNRKERASDLLMANVGELLGKKYVETYFSDKAKSKVREMVENVRLTYQDRLKTNTWMSDQTKLEALEKLAAVNVKIGYPDKWHDFSDVVITADHLVDNVIAARKHEHARMLAKLKKPVDKSEWLMPACMVNAYYNPPTNEICFPAAILQPPFYNPNADDAINYGGIIGVIGHEFTHGFDDEGSHYDARGNLRDWWTKEDREKFNMKAKEFGKLYTDYDGLVSGARINAAFTMGENIADLGGITLAYYAMEKSLEGKEKPAPIQGFTYQQRFFLSWATIWQNIITPEEEKLRLNNDPHSPARARTNVVLSNLKEFQDAWRCGNSSTPVANCPTTGKQQKRPIVIW